MLSALIGVCGPCQFVGVVHINLWVWSIAIGGCGLYQLVGVLDFKDFSRWSMGNQDMHGVRLSH